MAVDTSPKASLSSFAQHDMSKRLSKVGHIVAAFRQHTSAAPGSPTLLLDIGTGSGIIGHFVAQELGAHCIEVDVSEGRSFKQSPFVISSAEILPFRSRSFDFVICNFVIEHVLDQLQLLNEIQRVLKLGGVCYLSGPNKYWWLEPHYKLPFLSWIPQNLADGVVRLARRGKFYDVQPITRDHVQRLVGLVGLSATDLTLDMISSPRRYQRHGLGAWLSGIVPSFLTRRLLSVVPSYIWVLQAEHELTNGSEGSQQIQDW